MPTILSCLELSFNNSHFIFYFDHILFLIISLENFIYSLYSFDIFCDYSPVFCN